MVFSSSIFLFLFLPIVLGIYYLSPGKIKNITLLLFSLLFYTWGEDKIVVLLLASTCIDYVCGILIDKGKRGVGVIISIISNLSFLIFFKYFNFTFENFRALLHLIGLESTYLHTLPHIALPIGISFYTFQTLSYTIDVYRGQVKANYNFIDFAAYVTMFPQLIAGPIVRYSDIDEQLKTRNHTINNFSIGVERFIIGLAKKVLIANTFASIADAVFSQDLATLSTTYAWIGIIAYTFQIYYDFSGYSDMAIGLGKMFGFNFMENFNYPYIATNVREFWRRWHISLSTWFRDYLYIPLGGNRGSNIRSFFNLFLVFLVTGLWHGASWNFVVWGLFHGAFIVIERTGFSKLLNQLWKPLQHIYLLLIVVIGWVFFRVETMGDALMYLRKMFLFTEGDLAFSSYLDFFYLDFRTIFFTGLAVVFATPIHVYTKKLKLTSNFGILRPLGFISLFALTLIYLGANTYNPFIYFRF
jgi:alginate O-acetyltransferase complex protein AlgI